MNKCIGVIADDLTGSMDAGLQLANGSYTVKVALDSESLHIISGNTDIIIVDSESRNTPMDLAYKKVRYCAKKLREMNCSIIYKKIDSTMRGNIGCELEAVLEESKADCILLAPALPYNRRTTVNGIHYVDGIPLEETELAKDPFAPIHTSDLRDIIQAQTLLPTGSITIDTIRNSALEVANAIKTMINSGIKIIICDAADDADLACIAKAAENIDRCLIFCGSAGMLEYLVGTGNIPRPAGIQEKPALMSSGKNPVLVLSGTPASMSKKQIRQAVSASINLTGIYADLSKINGTPEQQKEERSRIFHSVDEALKTGRHVAVEAAGTDKHKLLRSANGDYAKLNKESKNIQRLLADIAGQFIEYPLNALVLFGGDTAISVSRCIGAKGIHIIDQIEPYIPLGLFIGSKIDTLPVVTKAGGFGNENTLINIIQKLG
jgi:uncharacterized protein YgbK (DUF1537 family)